MKNLFKEDVMELWQFVVGWKSFLSLQLSAVWTLAYTSIGMFETYVFADWSFLITLSVLLLLDTVLGVWRHALHKTVSSKGFGRAGKKTVLYLVLLILTHVLNNYEIQGEADPTIQTVATYFTRLIYTYIVCREALSIIENANHIYPGFVPRFIINKLKDFSDDGKLNNSINKKNEGDKK